ncbi:MAG: DNA mismatch repair endonuclease MutL [Thermodesulfovibrionales bacterium]
MSHINVLPLDVRNKIAAGEVIERPASVVKELLENAIDAGSTDIRIDVLSGGKRMIRVSDNGTGMDREDALLCFERHATSKLVSADDLFDIRTLGFRGEALPSIASISKVRLVTGLKGSGAGTSIEIAGGDVTETREAAAVGTMFEVRDLFFNTPARKKFLKTTTTELFHIIDIVTKEALSHPATAFSLYTDNKETLLLPVASGLRERIMQVYGDEFLKGLLDISTPSTPGGPIRMEAFVSGTSNFRNSRDHQFVFINKRPVRDPSVSHAVYKAYEGILPHDRHPIFFIFLEIDPRRIDFNVHPTKREVRFEDKESVYRLINGSLRGLIRGAHEEYTRPFSAGSTSLNSAPYPAWPAAYAKQPEFAGQPDAFVSETSGPGYRPSLPHIYLGDTFIAVSGRGGLTLIDHHAAHERVLYEKLLNRVRVDSHQLLFPEQVRLSHKEYRAILENKELLSGLGMEVDDFGHDTLIVRSLPADLSGTDIRGILSDIASAVLSGIPPEKSLRESLAARIACHSSVRGREVLNQEEIANLLHDLEQTNFPDQCPHGRPTRLFYSLEDLQKMFKRK